MIEQYVGVKFVANFRTKEGFSKFLKVKVSIAIGVDCESSHRPLEFVSNAVNALVHTLSKPGISIALAIPTKKLLPTPPLHPLFFAYLVVYMYE